MVGHTGKGTLNAIRLRTKSLNIVRPYAGAVCPRILFVHDNASCGESMQVFAGG